MITIQKVKKDIKSMNIAELKTSFAEMGEPAFKAGQVYSWLHQKRAESFDEMTNLSKALREKLNGEYYINTIKIKKSFSRK